MVKEQSMISLQMETPAFWDDVWKEAKERHSSRRKKRSLKESVRYWDKRAKNFDKIVGGKGKAERVNGVLRWLENQGVDLHNIKVLDIGAGPGAFALAFARRAKEVVALEPAETMAAILKKRIVENNIYNIRIIEEAWEEVDLEEHNLKRQFDLVFASMTPGVNNGETVDKALSCAKRYCFISSFAGKRENDALSALWQVLFGESMPVWPGNIIHAFNYLYARGLDLSFEVWEEKSRPKRPFEEAVFRLQEELRSYGVEKYLREDARVSQFVEERLVNGMFSQNMVTRHGRILVKL